VLQAKAEIQLNHFSATDIRRFWNELALHILQNIFTSQLQAARCFRPC